MKTRAYRVALWVTQAATVALFAVDRFGPGFISADVLLVLDAVISAAITAARQIRDATTPTLPNAGPATQP